MDTLQCIINRFERAKSNRMLYDSIFQDIADLVVINHGNFNHTNTGHRPEINRVFSNTAIEALSRLVSAIYNGMTNPGSRWFALKLKHLSKESVESMRWTDGVTDHLLSIFNSSYSGFALHNYSILKSWASFGTGCMYVEEDDNGKIRFSTIHLSEIFITENTYGDVDSVFRKFKMTAGNAIDRWGEENVSPHLLKMCREDPDKEIEVVHYVRPKSRKDYDDKSIKFNFISTYIDLTHRFTMSEKGYHLLPYVVPRFSIFVGDTYGRSPVWDCLNEIKMLNVMLKDVIKAGQLSAVPPLMTNGDNMLSDIQIAPGMILDGALNYDGNPTVVPLDIRANIPFAMQLVNFSVERIRESFFVDELYFKEGTPVTATEAIQRNEARLQALSPITNRLQIDYLNKLIDIVFDIEYRAGRIDKIPDELKDSKAEIEYLSPLANLQNMQSVQSIQRALSALAPISQVDPTVFDAFKFAKMGSFVAMATRTPGELLRTQAELDEIMKQRQAQAQQQAQQAQLQAYASQLNNPIQ